MELKKVYVNKDGNAVIVCPHCGKTRTVHVKKFRRSRDALKVKCGCQLDFTVCLEFRGAYRKQTRLPGHYTKMPESWGEMEVKNVSMTGIGFETLGEHSLEEGDEVTVKFALDDSSRTEVKKRVVVRVVKDNYIGCEFADFVEFDKALGFYLTS